MAGKLIVIEGTDGSGKSTQFARLCRRLEEAGRPFRRLVFPQYDKPSSALIRMYLAGAFGSHPGDVNPYAASAFYAVDRYASWKQEWGTYYQDGGLVLSDRYTTSNAVHQGCKLPEGEWEAFFRWLDDFEFERLGLPRPGLVIYLDMPTQQALRLLRQRERDTHTTGDIHEVDADYLARCRKTALAAAQCLGWRVIPCADEAGRLYTVDELHRRIWQAAERFLQAPDSGTEV